MKKVILSIEKSSYVEEVIPSLMSQKPEQSTLKQCFTQKQRKLTRSLMINQMTRLATYILAYLNVGKVTYIVVLLQRQNKKIRKYFEYFIAVRKPYT